MQSSYQRTGNLAATGEQQALALIETDRLDIDPGGFCEGTDGQILDYFFHFA